jgi:hypothetical protein
VGVRGRKPRGSARRRIEPVARSAALLGRRPNAGSPETPVQLIERKVDHRSCVERERLRQDQAPDDRDA